MRTVCTFMLTAVLLAALLTSADAGIRQEMISFTHGSSHTVRKGRITGRESIDYRVRARSGQALSVTFTPDNRFAYFNVLPPDSETALFVGSSSGNRFEAGLPKDGTYTIRVYLMRNAARRNEKSRYTLAVSLRDTVPAAPLLFDRTLELQGIRFRITSENRGSATTVRIIPAGLEIDNAPMERTIEGRVTGAETGDLNVDGSPEIYVYLTSTDSGSYGSLLAFAANRHKSLSEIYLPPFTDDTRLSSGYRGHDEFAVLEGVLGRRFPVYREADTDALPTGGMRQLQYKLIAGEADWLLTLDKTVEY